MSTRHAFSTRVGAVSTAKIRFTPLAEASQFAAASRGTGRMTTLRAAALEAAPSEKGPGHAAGRAHQREGTGGRNVVGLASF